MSLKIHQMFEGMQITTLNEIAEKLIDFNTVEIKRVEEMNRKIIVFRIDFYVDLTCLMIFNQELEQLFDLFPYIEEVSINHSISKIKLSKNHLGIYLQESNCISLTNLIIQKLVNQTTIHQLLIDLVTQIYQLHKQEILKINKKNTRGNQTMCESNQITIHNHSSIRAIFRAIQLFADSFGYQIDTAKLLEFIQIQDIIGRVDKQQNLQIEQLHSTEQIEDLLIVFPNIHLTRLSMPYASDHLVAFLTKKINLSNVRIFDLSYSQIEDKTLSALIACEYISNLNLSNCKKLTSNGLLQFFQSCILCNLVCLDVSSTQCNDYVFEAIWKNKSFSALSSLNYSNCMYNSAPFASQIIAQLNTKQEQIFELYLSHCNITNQILMALKQINNLRVLDISENPSINEWHHLKRDNNYHLLNIENCGLSKQDILFLFGFDCLKNCKIFISEQKRININKIPQLSRFLSLKNIKAEFHDFATVVQEICFDNSEILNIDLMLQYQMLHLCELSLQNCNLTDKSIEHLVQNQSLQNLVKLNLSKNLLFDVSLISIINTLINLRTLCFNETQVSDISIDTIVSSNIQTLQLKNCKRITPNGFCKLIMSADLKVQEIDISRNIINYELQYYLTNSSYNQTVIYDNQFDYKLLRTFTEEILDIQNEQLDLSRRTYINGNFENVLSTHQFIKIDLSYTFIRDSVIELISIWCSETLKSLILKGCQSLTNDCVKYLKQFKKLDIIDLSDTFVNQMESECIQLIYLNNHKSS